MPNQPWPSLVILVETRDHAMGRRGLFLHQLAQGFARIVSPSVGAGRESPNGMVARQRLLELQT